MRFEPFLRPEEIDALIQEEQVSDKEQKRTPEQIKAIYTQGNNLLVSASAGSGKTFVMVERIMDMILRGVTIEQLFISTFTVKAAGELKQRLEKKLLSEISKTSNTALKTYLNQQLIDLQTADIGTMDSFTQKFVMTYGYTMGISPQFRILQDQSEQDILQQDVFESLFRDFMEGPDSLIFQKLVKNFAGNSKDSKPFRQLVSKIYAFSQSTANPKQWLQDKFLKGAKTYTDFSAIPENTVQDILETMFQTADDLQDLTEMENYKQKTAKGTLTAAYEKHLKMIESLRDFANHFDFYFGRDGLGKLAQQVSDILPSGSDVTVNKIKYPIFKNLHGKLADFKHLETILTYQKESLPLLKVLQKFLILFSDQYLQKKLSEDLFEFTDIAHFAIAILEDNETIRQLYQNRYHEVMVDEYQDNNHIQERLLELLSNGHNRFMVGDIKQSIYRFRQADPQIFNQKFKTYQKDSSQGQLIILKENFRSQSEVLDATNSIFMHLMDEAVGEIDYDKDHFLLAGSNKQRVPHPENETEFLLFDEESLGEEENETVEAYDVKMVIKEIIALHNQRQVPLSDITLLVSSRTKNNTIIKAFEEYGIPIVADGGEQNYLKSVEVMVMLDTLRSIDNPLNDYALVALLKSPMFFFNEDELARIALQTKDDEMDSYFYQKLQNSLMSGLPFTEFITQDLYEKIERFLTYFNNWRKLSRRLSLYDLIWKIYDERFYYDYVGALPYGQKAQANLYDLALRANHYEKTGFKGLSRFIHMIDKILDRENDLADVEIIPPQNAVTLMTIHKSKGLEFPYVFILNCDKKFSLADLTTNMILSRDNGIGIKYVADMKEELGEQILPSVLVSMETLPYQINKRELRLATLSEQMRLLYVAMTRAKTKLYLVGKGEKTKLVNKYDGQSEHHHLPVAQREQWLTFQDWILAIQEAFSSQHLAFKTRFMEIGDLTDTHLGQLVIKDIVDKNNQMNNRQSDNIKKALDMLKSVQLLNHQYQAAINLPSVRTPSQLKKLYESLLDVEGVDVISKEVSHSRKYALPNFTQKKKLTGAEIGTGVHELMQSIPLHTSVSKADIVQTLSSLGFDTDLEKQIPVDKIFDFFQSTDLGQLFQRYSSQVYREAPFSMLKEDKLSHEKFVVRGIIDGFILLEEKIILFDYKTDRYEKASDMVKKYKDQMMLYAEALQKAYGKSCIEKYLILLGGQAVEVVEIKG